MKKHKVDIDLSIKVHEGIKDKVEIRECYYNVNQAMFANLDMFYYNTWKVAYGYYPTTVKGFYARHCFLVDSNGNAIDPTLPLQRYRDLDEGINDYYSFKIFETVESYIEALNDEGYYSLEQTLKEEDKKAIEWARENGIRLLQ